MTARMTISAGELVRLEKELDRLGGLDFRALHADLGEEVRNQVVARFKGEVDPEGRPWRKLADATLALRQKRKGRPGAGEKFRMLQDSGALRASINVQADRSQARVGPHRIYAAIHQFGGDAGRGRKVKIPARPYLGINADDERALAEIILEHLEGTAGATRAPARINGGGVR